MRMLMPILITFCLFLACKNDPDVKNDTEANLYYATYRSIYKNFDSIPYQQSIDSLKAYLKVYPQMPEAWLLYAYANHKTQNLPEAERACLKAIERDSLKVKPYEYLTAFLLSEPATYCDRVGNLIDKGLNLNDSSAVLLNNLSYYYLLCQQNNIDKAEFINKKALSINSTDKNYYRTASIIYHLKNNLNQRNLHLKLAIQHGLTDTLPIKAYFNNEIDLLTLYNSYE